MSVVEMSKIKLLGLSYNEEKILNALHKTGCVELKDTPEIDNTEIAAENKDKEEFIAKYDRAKRSVEFITENIEKSKGKEYYPKDTSALGNFFVSYEEFMSVWKKEDEIFGAVEKSEEYSAELLSNRSDKMKLINLKAQLEVYKYVNEKFSVFSDTAKTKVFLGTLKQENVLSVKVFLADFPLTEIQVLSEGALSVISIITVKEDGEAIEQKLNESGFTACPFAFDMTPAEKINETDKKIEEHEHKEESIVKEVCSIFNCIHDLKVLTDYYKFMIEKAEDTEKFRCTGTTFILEGYLPKDKEQEVKDAVYGITDAVFIEFSAPTKDDNPPTLLKNNPIVRQTEFVTDMYSTPNYREMDPGKVVFFFFMLFMGLIMADVGYGVVMIILGVLLAKRIKVDNGTRRLWYIIAIGGVFAMIFGALFNSYFGIKLPYQPLLPDPVPSATSGMDNLMLILLFCLGLGIVQIAVGYFCKAINSFKQRDVAGGLFDGIVWVIFFIGLIFAGFNFIFSYLMTAEYVDNMNPAIKGFFATMALPGVIMVAASVFIAAVTAGRNEKGFGKFTKGFGAVYGLINLMSDILSYARLFGLMLSGMIIASTFNDMGLSIISGGGVGYLLGPLVIIVGHVFNLAMGVLGAYIHDSRLQYIEFFGKFYTGEGEKFTPLGSKLDYVYLTK